MQNYIILGCFRDPYEFIRCNLQRIVDNPSSNQKRYPIDPSIWYEHRVTYGPLDLVWGLNFKTTP